MLRSPKACCGMCVLLLLLHSQHSEAGRTLQQGATKPAPLGLTLVGDLVAFTADHAATAAAGFDLHASPHNNDIPSTSNSSSPLEVHEDTTAVNITEAQATTPKVPPLYRGILAKHNGFRSRHGAPRLSWSSKVAAYSENWAKGCTWGHSPNTPYGENIFATTGTGRVNEALDQAITMWYREKKNYDFKNPGFASDTGHFTQIVWKATSKLGCRAAECQTLSNTGWTMPATFVVCNYMRPGNVGGAADFKRNVLPARSTRG